MGAGHGHWHDTVLIISENCAIIQQQLYKYTIKPIEIETDWNTFYWVLSVAK